MQAKLLHLAYSANIIETSSKRKKTHGDKENMSLWPTAQSILFLDFDEIFKCTVATSAIVIWSSLHIYHLLQLLTNIYPHVQVYGQCVKRPLPRHVIRILSGEFFGFLDEIGDVHWHLIDLG